MTKARKTNEQPGKVKAAIRELRRVHGIGTAMKNQLTFDNERPAYERGAHKPLVEKYKLSESMCRRYVRFAQLYTAWDLDDLCRQCDKYEYPLGFQVLAKLFGIPSKKTRNMIQRRVLKEKWTAVQIDNYRHNPDKGVVVATDKSGGRMPRAVRSLEHLIAEMKADARKWSRVWELLQPTEKNATGDDGPGHSQFSLDGLDPGLQSELKKLIKLLDGLSLWHVKE